MQEGKKGKTSRNTDICQTNAVPSYILFVRDVFEVTEVKIGLSLAYACHPSIESSLSYGLYLYYITWLPFLDHFCNV